MEFTHEDTERFYELLKWRRDVRHFKQDGLTEEVVAKLQQSIALAPSVGNSRPWRFINVESDETRSRIAINFEQSNATAGNAYTGKQLAQYHSLKLAGLREAPLQLAVFTDLSPAEGHGLGRQTMPETLVYSTIGAIHQMWLAARSLNVGVGWVSILKPGEMNELLEVDADWKFTAYLCVGYPSERSVSKDPELHRENWQKNINQEWLIR